VKAMANQPFEGYPLSPRQARLWRSATRNGSTALAQCAIRIEGDFDEGTLRESLRVIIARHEILRTTYHVGAEIDVPFQVIEAEAQARVAWREVEAGASDEDARRAALAALLREEATQGIDLTRGPVVRAALLRLGASDRILVLTLPALAADATTLGNIYEELSGADSDAEPLQYADYAAGQEELLEAEHAAEGYEFWRGHDYAAPARHRLPFERGMNADAPAISESVAVALGPEDSARLEAVASKLDATAEQFLLACWHTLIRRTTGESEVVVGYLFAGRGYEELFGAMGLLAKHLPVRAHFTETTPFQEVLRQVKKSAAEADEWQDYFVPEKFLGAKERATVDVQPPFGFEFIEMPGARRLSSVSFSVLHERADLESFRVNLRCLSASGELKFEFVYDARALRREDVERLARSFLTLVRAAVNDTRVEVADLPVLSEPDERRLLREFNGTEFDFGPARCINQLFEEQAARTPDATALVFEARHLSFNELNARANQLARRLRRLGVRPGRLCAILLDRSLETVVAMLAVLKAGGAYVPLDPAQPSARLRAMVEQTSPAALVTVNQHADDLDLPDLNVLDLDTEDIEAESTVDFDSGATPDDLIYVLFTSGSTGTPKGVAIEHRQLFNYFKGVAGVLQLPPGASYATVSTFAADLGNTVIFPSLLMGGTLHVMSQERISDAEALAQYFDEREIDCLKIVPSHLEALLNCSRPRHVLPRLRLVLGGEATGRGLVERLRALDPDCSIINHYGPTEATVGVLTYLLRDVREGDPASDEETPLLPLGRPLPNARVYILDARSRPVPVWVPGEIYIGGDCLARGYLNRPDLTAERFVPDPFSNEPGERVYRTGDLARYLPDGTVEFLGRVDNQVKIRGYRIELGEIEAKLARHAEVRESVVLARADTPGEKRLVAYVVARRHPAPPPAELRRHLHELLPEYMVPSHFVLLDELPLTSNGKIDRRALPRPEETLSGSEKVFVAPRNPVEEVLVNIWAEVLQAEEVGIHNNFFELGGHSLLAMQLLSRLRNVFQMELPLRLFFEAPTVAEFAEAMVAYEAQPGQVAASAEILKRIEGMSPEEVSRVLGGSGVRADGETGEEALEAYGD
jgi:amino acid adenylation domain-containing protein